MAENEQMVNLSIYDDMAAKHNAAYAAFKAMYETRTPPPLREAVKRENTWALAALVVMVVASVIVSGSRTVPEFGGGLVGYAAFCMVEMGIVAYAFIRTRTDYNEARHATVKTLVNRGMWLAFSVGVGANLHHELKKAGVDWNVLNWVIASLLAIAAPVLAFIAGDVLGMFAVRDNQRQRAADERYETAFKEWLDGLNNSWNAQKGRMGVRIEVESETRPALVSDVRPLSTGQAGQIGHGSGYKRESRAASLVRSHLDSNPADSTLSVRELADKLSVGKSTVANVLSEYRNGNGRIGE